MPHKPKLLLYIDGGSKGNPGPAACAAVVKTADDGQTVLEQGRYIGHATNNVAEYEGILLALELAAQLKAEVIEVRSDSELLVRQLTGVYRVKNEALQVLFAKVKRSLGPFKSVEIRHVPREENVDADRVVNETIKAHKTLAKSGGKADGDGRTGSFRLK